MKSSGRQQNKFEENKAAGKVGYKCQSLIVLNGMCVSKYT